MMTLESLTVADFRNFPSDNTSLGPTKLELGPRFTILHGHNGAGKTNLLEALYFVSTLRSFRGADLKTMLRHGCEHARIEVVGLDHQLNLPNRLEVRIDTGPRSTRRTASLNGKIVRSAAEFYGSISAILFTPEDLAVLRGSPGGRRRFIDRVVFAREKSHITDVQDYEKVLRSRNRVLKNESGLGVVDRTRMIEAYDQGLAKTGARIWGRRVRNIEALQRPFFQAFEQIHGTGLRVELQYKTKLENSAGSTSSQPLSPASSISPPLSTATSQDFTREQTLLRALREHRLRDEARRSTSIGPHLDDLQVMLDGAPAGDFASQGQARALILAFKIAELRTAHEATGVPPLLLLDDVSSELDPRRNIQLFETLSAEVGQCVLTTTAPHFIKLPAAIDRREVEVREGQLLVQDKISLD